MSDIFLFFKILLDKLLSISIKVYLYFLMYEVIFVRFKKFMYKNMFKVYRYFCFVVRSLS